VGPDGSQHQLESGVAHAAGTYPFTTATFDHEGTWKWDVSATDDLGRASTIERTFRYDTTLRALAVPQTATRSVRVGFTLSRPAQGALRIETAGGVVIRALPATALQPGGRSLRWDGRLPGGSLAFSGTYVARVLYTSEIGTSERALSFRFRR